MKFSLSPIFIALSLGVAFAADPGSPAYWAQREKALNHFTFVWKLTTHDLFIAWKPIPAQTMQMGDTKVTIPALDHNFEFTKSTQLTFARYGDLCQVEGRFPAYDLSNKKAGDIIQRNFFGEDWTGGLGQVPIDENLKQGIFEVYANPARAITCELSASAHEYDGEFAPFLYAVNPFEVYHLDWKVSREPNGAILLRGQNFDGIEHVTNFMASNGPEEFEYRLASNGRLLSETAFANRNTNPGKLPFHTFKVLEWRTLAGYPIPSKMYEHCNRDISGRRYSGFHDKRWELIRVIPTKEEPGPPIPIGTRVADWRLQQTEYHPGASPAAPGVEAVFYPWDGHLPTMDELRGIAKQNPPSDGTSVWAGMLAFGGPLLLIGLGGFLVWRGKGARKVG